VTQASVWEALRIATEYTDDRSPGERSRPCSPTSATWAAAFLLV